MTIWIAFAVVCVISGYLYARLRWDRVLHEEKMKMLRASHLRVLQGRALAEADNAALLETLGMRDGDAPPVFTLHLFRDVGDTIRIRTDFQPTISAGTKVSDLSSAQKLAVQIYEQLHNLEDATADDRMVS